MPAVFPTLQPDELFYSAIARYSDMMQLRSELRLWHNLFVDGNPQISTDFTGQLDLLLSRLPAGHGYTAKDIIRYHTTFPYYSHFVDSETTERGMQMLASKQRMQAISPVKTLGLLDPWQKSPAYLRYCTECVEEDTDRPFGEPYWHRAHQLAGVLVCPTHGTPLQVSNAERFWRKTSPSYLSLRKALKQKSKSVSILPQHRKILAEVAKESQWILETERTIEEKPTVWNRSLCLSRGWRYSTGTRMDFQKMLKTFLTHWDQDFWGALLPEIRYDSEDIATWLRHITLPSRSQFVHHPLKHVLLHRFLEANIDGSKNEAVEKAPFSKTAPQDECLDKPCMNIVCTRYTRSNSEKMRSVMSDLARRGVKYYRVKCKTCGFEHRRSTDHKNQYRRILKTGGVWDAEFGRLASSGFTPHAMARRLGVSRSFILDQAARMGLQGKRWDRRGRPRMSRPSEEEIMAQRIAARRTIWLNLQVEYPRETRFQLGQREKAVYYYLLDKDREWFEKNSPARTHMGERSKMKKRRGKGKVFWKERDSEMLRKLVSAVEEIRNLPEVPRITIGKLIRHIGESKPVKTIMPSKLPKTWRFVNEVAETIDQRTCRAIWEFAKVYAEKGEVPTQ